MKINFVLLCQEELYILLFWDTLCIFNNQVFSDTVRYRTSKGTFYFFPTTELPKINRVMTLSTLNSNKRPRQVTFFKNVQYISWPIFDCLAGIYRRLQDEHFGIFSVVVTRKTTKLQKITFVLPWQERLHILFFATSGKWLASMGMTLEGRI